MNWQDYLRPDAQLRSGVPVVVGANVPADRLLQELAEGRTRDELLARYPNLTQEILNSVLEYAAEIVAQEQRPVGGRFEGQSGVWEVTNPLPVRYGTISYFFAARNPRTSEPVLLKVFSDTPATRGFYEEIELLQRISQHDHILTIYDYGFRQGGATPPFLVLPVCEGGNLREWMQEGDFGIPLDAALDTLRQVAEGIDFAHQNRRVHGDIKPENILFVTRDRGRAVVSDFGMAKHFDVVDRVRRSGALGIGRRQTEGVQEKLVGGTSAYLSPEQLDRGVQTKASDIYAFALVTYELLVGVLPFDLEQPLYRQFQNRVEGLLNDPTQANPEISATVSGVLMAGLHKDPEGRPRTAREFCDRLIDAQARARQHATRPGTTTDGALAGGVFVSYAWTAESDALVDDLVSQLQARGMTIVRDKKDLGFRGSIKAFMEMLGQGGCVILVISDAYLRSTNCMFELLEVAKHLDFVDRIFPIVLEDARIYDPVERLRYVEYWEQKQKQLNDAMTTVGQANLQGFREEIDLYARVRATLPSLADVLGNMNALTPDAHRGTGFQHLFDAITTRLG